MLWISVFQSWQSCYSCESGSDYQDQKKRSWEEEKKKRSPDPSCFSTSQLPKIPPDLQVRKASFAPKGKLKSMNNYPAPRWCPSPFKLGPLEESAEDTSFAAFGIPDRPAADCFNIMSIRFDILKVPVSGAPHIVGTDFPAIIVSYDIPSHFYPPYLVSMGSKQKGCRNASSPRWFKPNTLPLLLHYSNTRAQ